MTLEQKLAELIKEHGLEAVKGGIVTFDSGECSEGFHWDDKLKKCVEDVG